MSNKEFELEQEIILIGGKEALEFAKDKKLNLYVLKDMLLKGIYQYDIIAAYNILIKLWLANKEAHNLALNIFKPMLNNLDKERLEKINMEAKYNKRCRNRQKLYNKRKKLGRVK